MFGSTLPLFKKVVQNLWLNLTTFQKSGKVEPNQPLEKVEPNLQSFFGLTFLKVNLHNF